MDDIFAQASAAALRGERLSRERDAYRYICAWDRDDFRTLCDIRDRALADKELEQILDDIDEELIEELDNDVVSEVEVSEEERKRVHEKVLHLMRQYDEEV